MIINKSALIRAAPIRYMLTDKLNTNGTSYGLSEAGYDIRIKQDIKFFPDDNEIFIDKDRIITGNFCIASAIEEFQMPNNLVAIVHDKSTWARKGLSVFNTVIEPGWKGFLTLELVYHGQDTLRIPAGSGIAQVIFHELAVPAQYEGKYQNQEDRPIGSIFE